MQGSLTNRLMERMHRVPEVGMGATACLYSDRHAYTIIEVHPNGNMIKVQRCEVRKRAGTTYLDQEYDITPNPKGYITTLRRRKDGRWREKGAYGTPYTIGRAEEYQDPEFWGVCFL